MEHSVALLKLANEIPGIAEFCDLQSFEDIFCIQMRDFIGNPYTFTGESFQNVKVSGEKGKVSAVFSGCESLPGTQVAFSAEKGADNSLEWHIEAIPGRNDFMVEWMDFPRVRFIKDAACRFLIPNAEGVLIPDLEKRESNACFKCTLAEYPLTGINSFYPGPAAAQFEAFYNNSNGVYIACPDKCDNPKVIDFMPDNGRARIVLQHFTGGSSSLGYKVVMRPFAGNWQDAAEIYRNWLETEKILPEKLVDNMPELLDKSPVVIAYPVKGTGMDAGGLTPNEYFPYINALGTMDKYSEMWDNSILAVLMHWEGTAPWAPPFIWPPAGGEDMLREFVDAMHTRGNSVGLYASGTGWTQKSMIDPEFTLEERFAADHVEREICRGPRGEAFSRVCNGPRGQRIGYDLCAYRQYTSDVVANEVKNAAACGVDYLQYFDQNQGCTSPLCYARDHGHPAVPGAWQTAAMQNLLDKASAAAGSTMIGCENAAAQPYIKVCKLNDLRNNLSWSTGGKPVELYSYLYHEYTSGFSGNGVCNCYRIDMDNTPFFALWNLSWNFVSGNLLSVVLKDGGDFHWSWCLPWDKPGPDQESLRTLIGNLSRWRKGRMKKFLVAGRMVKCPQIITGACDIVTFEQGPVSVPVVPAAAWQDGEKTAVTFANSSGKPSECTIVLEAPARAVIETAAGTEEIVADKVTFTIPALDAALVTVG